MVQSIVVEKVVQVVLWNVRLVDVSKVIYRIERRNLYIFGNTILFHEKIIIARFFMRDVNVCVWDFFSQAIYNIELYSSTWAFQNLCQNSVIIIDIHLF